MTFINKLVIRAVTPIPWQPGPIAITAGLRV